MKCGRRTFKMKEKRIFKTSKKEKKEVFLII
jgi:hypothetical protein